MLKHISFKVLIVTVAIFAGLIHAEKSARDIKHRFLAVDESRRQLHYINQYDKSKSWSINLPSKARDLQLIGNNQLMLSLSDGYIVYDLKTKKIVKKLLDKKYQGTNTVRRLADGRTIIGCEQHGISFFELDKDDKLLRTANFPKLKTLRLMRVDSKEDLYFGCNTKEVVVVNLDGKIVKKFTIKHSKHIYQVLPVKGGNFLVATGYPSYVGLFDGKGKSILKWGGKQVKEEKLNFFAGMQVLKNRNIVVCNWTGHGANDSSKGVQLVEFDRGGKVVWRWHNPKSAGSLHGIIILDDLDTAKMNDDSQLILRNNKK